MKKIGYLIFHSLIIVMTLRFVLYSVDGAAAETNSITDSASLLPINLTCEYRINPLGVDVTNPRLSWRFFMDDEKTHSSNGIV